MNLAKKRFIEFSKRDIAKFIKPKRINNVQHFQKKEKYRYKR